MAILSLVGCPAFHPVSVVSPLNMSKITLDLAGNPDQQAVAYVLEGLQHSFRLGFQPASRLKAAKKNINPPPFRIPRSTRWLDVGLHVPFLQFRCQTYK